MRTQELERLERIRYLKAQADYLKYMIALYTKTIKAVEQELEQVTEELQTLQGGTTCTTW